MTEMKETDTAGLFLYGYVPTEKVKWDDIREKSHDIIEEPLNDVYREIDEAEEKLEPDDRSYVAIPRLSFYRRGNGMVLISEPICRLFSYHPICLIRAWGFSKEELAAFIGCEPGRFWSQDDDDREEGL